MFSSFMGVGWGVSTQEYIFEKVVFKIDDLVDKNVKTDKYSTAMRLPSVGGR